MGPKIRSLHAYFILLFTTLVTFSPCISSLRCDIFSLDISPRLHIDSHAITEASTDYGNLVQKTPAAVLYPSSINDFVDLVKFSNNCSTPFRIAARGRGHSVRGQAMAYNGVVVDMFSLNTYYGSKTKGIRVSWSQALGFYADVGGEQLWIDVLRATLGRGLAPVSWTDYLYLTVGGTLSNAGISGQTFRYGPQIANVHEMDVITGKGEFVTCSKYKDSELFYAVLGGLGQFGIITRARIVLAKAPKRVKWVQMIYDNFSHFTRDQEQLISINGGDYVEGSLILQPSPLSNQSCSFFSMSDQSRINNLISKHPNGILYSLELVKYYDDSSKERVEEELQLLVKGLNFIPGFMFEKDVPLTDFLNRVRSEELNLRSMGQWDVPHPWLNLFVPKSRIMDFNSGVFADIIRRQNKTAGLVLVYPMFRNRWDARMSAAIPDEDTFYTVGLLRSSGFNEWEILDEQNKEILQFCEKAGIHIKQYLPHYNTKGDWRKHFGAKWNTIQERKTQFDPNLILSPGQQIFTNV